MRLRFGVVERHLPFEQRHELTGRRAVLSASRRCSLAQSAGGARTARFSRILAEPIAEASL